MKNMSLVVLVLGFYLIIEAALSFIFLSDDNPLFQLGRLGRIFVGVFLILLVQTRSIK